MEKVIRLYDQELQKQMLLANVELLILNQQFDEAIKRLKLAYQIDPSDIKVNIILGEMYLSHLKDFKKALKYYQFVYEREPENPVGILGLGRCYSLLEDYLKGIELIEKALKLKPYDYETKFFLGKTYTLASTEHPEYFSKAIKIYDELKKEFPDKSDVWYFLGLLFLENNYIEEAIENLEHARTLDPDNADILGVLGKAWSDLDFHKSQDYYEAALELDPYNEEALTNVRMLLLFSFQTKYDITLEERARNYRAFSTFRGPDGKMGTSALTHFYSLQEIIRFNVIIDILNLFKNHKYAAALNRLTFLSDWEPEHADVWQKMGLCYYYLSDTDNALSCFKRALSIKPALFYSHVELAILYSLKDDLPSAISLLQDVGDRSKSYHKSKLLLGHFYEKQGETTKAQELYKLALNKKEKITKEFDEQIKFFRKNDRFDLALILLELIEKLSDDKVSVFELLAKTHANLGNLRESLSYYQRAYSLDSQSPQIQCGYGVQLYKNGELSAAINNLQEVIHKQAFNGDALFYLGLAFLEKDDDPKIINYLEELKSTSKINSLLDLVLANLYLFKEEFDKGISILNEYTPSELKSPRMKFLYHRGHGKFSFHYYDYSRAIPHIEKALNYDPTDVELKKIQGFSYLRLGDYFTADEILTEASKFYPDDSEVKAALKLIEKIQSEEISIIIKEEEISTKLDKNWQMIFNVASGRKKPKMTWLSTITKIPEEQIIHQALINGFFIDHGSLFIISEEITKAIRDAHLYESRKNYGKTATLYEQIIDFTPYDTRRWLNLSSFYERANKWRKAISTIMRAIERNPDSKLLQKALVKCWLNKGSYFQEKGNFIEAGEAYYQAINLDPKIKVQYREEIIDNWLKLSLLLKSQGELKMALEALYEGINTFPDCGKIYFFIGMTNLQLGNHEKIVEAMENAVKYEPELVLANCILAVYSLYENKKEASIKYFSEVAKSPTIDSIQNYYVGKAYFKFGLYDEAITAFNKVSDEVDEYLEVLYHQGLAYERSDQSSEAKKVFKKALKLARKKKYYQKAANTSHLRAAMKGLLYLKLEKISKAQKEFEKLRENAPNLPQVWIGLGDIAFSERDVGQALAYYNQALAKYQENKKILFEKYLILERLVKVLELKDKKNVEELYWLGRSLQELAYQNEENLTKALEFFSQAVAINVNHDKSLYQLGMINNQLGNKDKAISYLERTLEINDKYPQAWYELSELYKESDSEKSRKYMKKAIEQHYYFDAEKNQELNRLFSSFRF
ncbi:MAG: tetratricopeptide repeat protein [Candidatus Heimdallarchaeota archaeon]|nr:tetratricopeptide repeat protein [Candidatus Heimdallarchaeota archaeon]